MRIKHIASDKRHSAVANISNKCGLFSGAKVDGEEEGD